MFTPTTKRNLLMAAAAFGCLIAGSRPVSSADLDPKALTFKLPDQIQWTGTGGNRQAILYGDPSKAGLYVELTKWLPGNMSRPHSHPNDRYIYVVSGTWWVGTGPNYDPASTTAMPAGSFVVHKANELHYDGAKDGECVLEIVGMGPASSTQANKK